MIEVELGAAALARVRISYSPMWEVGGSLRQLVHDRTNSRHAPWMRWAATRLDPDLFELLRGLVPNPHESPVWLFPPPARSPVPIATELSELAGIPADELRAEVALTVDEDRGPVDVPLLRGPRASASVAEALAAYWDAVLAPVWSAVHRLLEADLAFRADRLASDGLRALLNDLHPLMTFDGTRLRLDTPRHAAFRRVDDDGLTLVPCVFGSPSVVAVVDEPHPVTFSFPPRGIGTLWQDPGTVGADPVVALLGRGRASILALLDVPLTGSQLAAQSGHSQAAISKHLVILRQAGLVSSNRTGQSILTTRTALGSALLNPETE